MGKITGIKRALSVLLTLSLLISAMAVAGVSAAVVGTEYHITFDASDGYDYHANYYVNHTTSETWNNCNATGVETKLVAGGYNGSDYLMKMAYTANGTTADKQHYASFSVPNNTGSNKNGRNHGQTVHLETDGTFRITVTYKVASYVSPMALYYNINMGALSDNDIPNFSACYPTKIVDITAATADWTQASVIVKPAYKQGAYFTLKMVDDANRAGTEVQIGAIDIVPIDPATLPIIKFDSKGGSAVGDLMGEVGAPIGYPIPTKDGYDFVGWFTEGDQPAPTTFTAGTVNVYAKWVDSSTPPAPQGTAYTYDFSSAYKNDKNADYYTTNGGNSDNNNTIDADSGADTRLVTGGYNGSPSAMQMAYNANGKTEDKQFYSAISLPNYHSEAKSGRAPGKSVHLETGALFRIRVTYKVTGYTSAGALYAAIGNYPLSDRGAKPEFSKMSAAKIADITGTTDWVTKDITYVPATDANIYLLLKMADDTNRAGTKVLIGKLEIIPLSATTISFDSDGGSYVSAITGECGTDVTYPANPTKAGYEFLGWFTDTGDVAPAKFQNRNIELTARWLDLSVWSFENEAKDTELSLNAASGFSAKVTDETQYTGNQALRITSNNKTGVGRPQFFVKDANGARVAVESGKNYVISFRVKVPAAANLREFHFWMNATERTGAYASADNELRKQEKLIEVNSIKLADHGGADQWFLLEYTVRNCEVDGYVMMGITGDSTSAHTFYIDDLKVAEEPYVAPEAGVWSFENEANDTLLSLNTRTETAIRTDGTVAHSGYAAARVNSDNSSGDGRPQMTVKDADGNTVMIEQGKNYIITFYAMVPAGEADYRINYWFTASPDETLYKYGEYSKNQHLIVEGVESPAAKGEWKKITAVVEKSAHAGMLRLGICADGNDTSSPVKFYIDDIKVEPIGSIESVVQSFEDYNDGDELDLNSADEVKIIASDAVGGNTGTMAAEIRSNTNAGNPRPQMMLKTGLGQQIQVYKGRSYEVKFYVYVPSGQPDYEISWWLTATNDETCFSNGGVKKDDFVVAQDDDDTLEPPVGEWTEVTVSINSCRYSGKLRLGITGTTQTPHTFYIDDISIREVKADPESKVNSFEIETYVDGADVSLNNSITVSREDSRDGITSVKVKTAGNDVNAAPQMVLENFRGEDIAVERGKKYRVSFWVVVPSGETDYDIQFWLAATDSDAAFTTARDSIVVDTKTVAIDNKNTWQYVSADIKNCPYAGNLRLGITGSTNAVHTFYIDDVKVEERISAEPDPDAMNFENYEDGTKLALNGNDNTITVTSDESYTGDKSVLFHSVTNGGDNRPQMMVKDANGNQVKLEKGESYYVSFKMMVPFSEDYFNFSYWVALVPDDKVDAPFVRETDFLKNDYVIYEKNGDEPPEAGIWKEYKVAIMNCPKSGNLRVGFTHYNGDPFTSNFYIDDIKVSLPEYVLVKFDTNGSEDTYEDIYMMADMRIPFEGVDPYREGYEFMGWYTDKSFKKEFYFDIANDLVTGKTGDVLILYACWKKWDEVSASGTRQEETKYKTEYYTEKVWVGDQNTPEPWDTGDKLVREDAAPIVVTPDEVVPEAEGGMPPWLIVVIIVCAVAVVGGGAVLAAILLKKNKKA